jgi:hypothetical protein
MALERADRTLLGLVGRRGGIKGVLLRALKGYKSDHATAEQRRWIEAERLCKRYGWTLDYALSLNARDIIRIRGVLEAEAEFQRIEEEKAKMRRANKPRRR